MSQSMYERAIELFRADQWDIVKNDEAKGEFLMPITTRVGSYVCLARPLESHGIFCFYSMLREFAQEDRKMAAAEFVTRANFDLVSCAFEFSLEEGSLRLRSTLILGDT